MSESVRAKRKILVVDDSAAMRRAVTQSLVGAGYDVVPCEVSVELLGMMREHEPDLILLDVNMPFLEGDQLCELIKPHAKGPIVFLSGRPEAELAAMTAAKGADGYICKADGVDRLPEQVRRFLPD